ncbi:hypothetical protein ES707_16767 [subsurface metagenome]|jgi:hypothetical protein
MGPFASKNVINEIQIRQGKWISLLGQISETELSKETAIPQTSETETSKEATETTETVVEEDSTAEKPKVSAISQITVFLIAVPGVLLVMIFVLHIRGRASQ